MARLRQLIYFTFSLDNGLMEIIEKEHDRERLDDEVTMRTMRIHKRNELCAVRWVAALP